MKTSSMYREKILKYQKFQNSLYYHTENTQLGRTIFSTNKQLKKQLEDNNQMFYQYEVLAVMVHAIMTTAHNDLRSQQLQENIQCCQETLLLEKDEEGHPEILHCTKCNLYKTQKYEFERKTCLPGVPPMEFISMDLIGRISPPSSQGHQYTLTVICMLTGFTFCIPVKTKNKEEIVDACLKYVVYTFAHFKIKLLKEVIEKLGIVLYSKFVHVKFEISQISQFLLKFVYFTLGKFEISTIAAEIDPPLQYQRKTLPCSITLLLI